MDRNHLSGQSLVEFALILPVLLLIFMGILDFGRAVFAYNALSNAAREGARVAIVDQSTSGGVSAAAQRAADSATNLSIDPSTDVDVAYTEPVANGPCLSHAIGCIATVTVRDQFQAITPIIGSIVGPIDLESTTSLVIESTNP
jgi:Flp pilus assembly protein TadG